MTRRTFYAMAALVVLVLAGGASYYASARPDGLERAATSAGFADSAEEPRLEGPLADYSARGVDDARLSNGVAGTAGVLLVATASGALFWVLRRRSDT